MRTIIGHSWRSSFSFVFLFFIGLIVPMLLLGNWSPHEKMFDGYEGPVVYNQRVDVNSPLKVPKKGPGYPPVLAYCLFGTRGDSERILRLLKAVYHPRNQYLLYLDGMSSNSERSGLVASVESQQEFRAFGNVHVVAKVYPVSPMGASNLAVVLHAAAVLLRLNEDWDWYTILSASDYPLMTQDDILYALSSLPRHLNFVHFTHGTDSDSKEKKHGGHEIVVDPSLYLIRNREVIFAEETRDDPDAFKIYRGSPWITLSRSFTDHCVIGGWDNLPRKLLLYFTNAAFPLENYFHTILCNTPELQNTTVNSDLRYYLLQTKDSRGAGTGMVEKRPRHDDMVSSRVAAFARPFEDGDQSLLEEIDRNILKRSLAGLVRGKWCTEPEPEPEPEETTSRTRTIHVSQGEVYSSSDGDHSNYCSHWGDIDSIGPGRYGMLLSKAFSAAAKSLFADQCHTIT